MNRQKGGKMVALPTLVAALDFLLRETALFAAVGFVVLGLSDLAVDLVWLAGTLARLGRGDRTATVADLPRPRAPGPIAVYVPAWDEAAVIGAMLRHALEAFGGAEFRLYVGCYPNDPATIAAARSVTDPRVRIVLGPVPGPTTKADCLNRLWDAMTEDEVRLGRRFKAIVLHDAEDVVHSAELAVFASLIERAELVQLPVLPLIDPRSRWVSGHYADEFAEAHGKSLVVRQALGAALPSAGVACALCRDTLGRLAVQRGTPFDGDSLTEDYELGLRLGLAGGRAAFVRIAAGPGKAVVATREFFPGTLRAAISQKSRWMRGIALSGWDRLGWSGGFAERWMRMRDRQSILAALLLTAGYAAFALWTLRAAAALALGLAPIQIPRTLQILLTVNGALLLWRLAMRFGFVAAAYGWREGLRSIPRTLVANLIAVLAAAHAVTRYRSSRGTPSWDKTDHAFPSHVPAE
jgi:adsorption protein B